MLHALAVEDDDGHAAILAAMLDGVAHVQRASTIAEARAVLGWVVPDVVLCDLRGTSDAAPLLAATDLRIALDRAGERVLARIPLVLVSGVEHYVLREIAATLTDTHWLPKPFRRGDLRALVERLTGVT